MLENSIRAASSRDCVLVRVVGHGTLQESPAFGDFVRHCLAERNAKVVVDFSECEYLDSTFLGCLIGLQKAGEGTQPRFQMHADAQRRIKLFSTTLLDRFFGFVDESPAPVSDFVEIESQHMNAREMGKHVMQCHRRLAACGGSQAHLFQSVADRLQTELDE